MKDCSPVEVAWTELEDDQETRKLKLKIEDKGTLNGCIWRNYDEETELTIDSFDVPEDLRARGIGTRLMMAALALAKVNGATISKADIGSLAAMRIRQKIFGSDMEVFGVSAESDTLPFSVQEAMISLNGPRGDILGFRIVANLAQIDTSDWELPREAIE